MKNFRYYIILLSSVICFTACSNDVDDIFGQLPTERVNEAVKALSETLESSPNGWKVAYFPDPESYGAYNFIMTFDGKDVTMQGDRLFPTGKHTSLYSITATQGPTLTFDTYTIITQLADPTLYYAGEGLRGDNEFVWMSTAATKDTIVFKGKKSGSKIEFIKFTQDWDTYFDNINKITDLYTTGEMNRFFKQLVMDDGSNVLLCGYDGVRRTINPMFEVKKDSIVQEVNGVSFTEDGLRFYRPFEFNNKSIQNLAFDESTGYFKVTDPGVNAYVKGINQPEFIFTDSNKEVFNTGETWAIDMVSSDLQESVNNIITKVDNYYGIWFIPLDNGGHQIYVIYVDGNTLYPAAAINISYAKSSDRSDKFTFRRPTSLAIQGPYASIIRADLEKFVRTMTANSLRPGLDYIVIPEDDGRYTLGSCGSNTSLTISYVE